MAVHLVCYAGIANPGHSYSMSSSYWVNTGTEPETLVFRVDPPAGASWIKMEESSVTLDPGQAASIPVTLTVPVGAAKGIYGARLEASGTEESVEFGVGVRPGCTGPAAPPLVPGGGRGFPVPIWVVAGLLLATALLTWLARQRRMDCDHPVHRLRGGGKWQSLTVRDMLRVAGEPGPALVGLAAEGALLIWTRSSTCCWAPGIKSVDKIDEILLAIDRHILLRTGEQDYCGRSAARTAVARGALVPHDQRGLAPAARNLRAVTPGYKVTSRTPVKSLNSQNGGKSRMS